MQNSMKQAESLSPDVMALCALLARILYRRLADWDTRTVNPALSPNSKRAVDRSRGGEDVE